MSHVFRENNQGTRIYFLCVVDYAMTGLLFLLWGRGWGGVGGGGDLLSVRCRPRHDWISEASTVSFQTMYIGHVKRSHVLRLQVLSVRFPFPSSVARSSHR